MHLYESASRLTTPETVSLQDEVALHFPLFPACSLPVALCMYAIFGHNSLNTPNGFDHCQYRWISTKRTADPITNPANLVNEKQDPFHQERPAYNIT